jgi:hypothetical protein
MAALGCMRMQWNVVSVYCIALDIPVATEPIPHAVNACAPHSASSFSLITHYTRAGFGSNADLCLSTCTTLAIAHSILQRIPQSFSRFGKGYFGVNILWTVNPSVPLSTRDCKLTTSPRL